MTVKDLREMSPTGLKKLLDDPRFGNDCIVWIESACGAVRWSPKVPDHQQFVGGTELEDWEKSYLSLDADKEESAIKDYLVKLS